MTARVCRIIPHVRSSRSFGASVLIFAALLFSPQLAAAQSVFTQQGPKLVGTGAVGSYPPGYADQGAHVALSGDGNTALVGGPTDNSNAGAVWVYTRSGGVWTQQGSKLVGTGAVGPTVQQGDSVALSGDGNTAIVGGQEDNSLTGAAWVFVQLTKNDCQNGGWLNFIGAPGPFTSQGQCVSYFAKLK
jgi:hypothetical protein